jgi:hypothetical protein
LLHSISCTFIKERDGSCRISSSNDDDDDSDEESVKGESYMSWQLSSIRDEKLLRSTRTLWEIRLVEVLIAAWGRDGMMINQFQKSILVTVRERNFFQKTNISNCGNLKE